MPSHAIDSVASRLVHLARQRNWRLSTAESCTGGLVAAALTDIPGASQVFGYGFVTYANDAKERLLHVAPELLATHGAVSAEVATAMAAGALQQSHAQLAVAVTGIAGPDGGSAEKPVGLVHFGVAVQPTRHTPMVLRHAQLHFEGDRTEIREQAAVHALVLMLGEIDT